MKFYLLSVIGLVCSLSVSAQISGQLPTYTRNADGGISDAIFNYSVGDIAGRNKKTNLNIETIKGSPYEYNDFKIASLYDENENLGQIFYRYNAYNQEVEIRNKNIEGEITKSLARNKFIKLRTLDGDMVYRTFIDLYGNTQNGYLYLVEEGKLNLYKRLKITFKEGSKAKTTFEKDIPAKFLRSESYYIEKEGGNKIIEVQKGKKDLTAIISDDMKAHMKKIISEHNLNLKNQADLIKFVQLFNKS